MFHRQQGSQMVLWQSAQCATLLLQAEAQRAGLMQQVADLTREHAAIRNSEGAASPLHAAVKKEVRSTGCCQHVPVRNPSHHVFRSFPSPSPVRGLPL